MSEILNECLNQPELTRPFDQRLQVSAAGAPGVHLEVTDLFHPQPRRLEAAARRPARARHAGWTRRRGEETTTWRRDNETFVLF